MYENIFTTACAKIPIIGTLKAKGLIDLAIITGSFARGDHDTQSDIDLFIILPFSVQKKYELLPEYIFEISIEEVLYKVEISFVTTEKLELSQESKSHIFWWHNAICVYSKDSRFYTMLEKAAHYTDTQKDDALWTLNFQFKLGLYDFEKTIKRRQHDDISLEMVYYDCLRIFLEFILTRDGIARRFTGFMGELRDRHPELYTYIVGIKQDTLSRRHALKHLSKIIDDALIDHGFSRKEVGKWNGHNLTRLTFQRY